MNQRTMRSSPSSSLGGGELVRVLLAQARHPNVIRGRKRQRLRFERRRSPAQRSDPPDGVTLEHTNPLCAMQKLLRGQTLEVAQIVVPNISERRSVVRQSEGGQAGGDLVWPPSGLAARRVLRDRFVSRGTLHRRLGYELSGAEVAIRGIGSVTSRATGSTSHASHLALARGTRTHTARKWSVGNGKGQVKSSQVYT